MTSDERVRASTAYKCGQFTESISFCEQGIRSAQSNEQWDECWLLRILHSLCLCAQGKFSEAVTLLEGPGSADDVSVETRARIQNQKAFALSRHGKFAEAKDALEEALRLAATQDARAVIAEIEINRSTLVFYLGKYDEVEDCARTALAIAGDLKLPMIEASACAGLGKSYMYRERQAEAIPWFERALALYEKEGATSYADIMRSELGCCHFALGESDKASVYFIHALRVSRESGALAFFTLTLPIWVPCIFIAANFQKLSLTSKRHCKLRAI